MGIIKKRIVVLLAVFALMTASFASCGVMGEVEEDGETLSVLFQGEIDGQEDWYAFLIENTSDESIMSAQIDIAGLDKDGNTIPLAERYNQIRPQNEGVGMPIHHLRPGEKAFVSVNPLNQWEEKPASFDIEFEQVKQGDDEAPSFSVVDAVKDPYYAHYEVTLKNEGDEEYTWYSDSSDEFYSLDAKGERTPFLIAVEKDADGNVTQMDVGMQEIDGDSVVFGPGEEKTITCNFYADNPNYEIIVTY